MLVPGASNYYMVQICEIEFVVRNNSILAEYILQIVCGVVHPLYMLLLSDYRAHSIMRNLCETETSFTKLFILKFQNWNWFRETV